MIKYGHDNFCLIIASVYGPSGSVSIEQLFSLEQSYFDLLKPEYNILKIANSSLGFKHSIETLKKYSDSRKKSKNPMFKKTKSAAFLKFQKAENKIGANNPMFGKTHSAAVINLRFITAKLKRRKPVYVYSAENHQIIIQFSTVHAALKYHKMGWDTLAKYAKTGSSYKGFYFYFKNVGKLCNPLDCALPNKKNLIKGTHPHKLKNGKPVSVYLVENEKLIIKFPRRIIAREQFKIPHGRLKDCLNRGSSFNGFYFCNEPPPKS